MRILRDAATGASLSYRLWGGYGVTMSTRIMLFDRQDDELTLDSASPQALYIPLPVGDER